MKGIGIIVAFAAIILVLSFAFIYIASSPDLITDPIHENDNDNNPDNTTDDEIDDGNWGQDIKIFFKDGTSESLVEQVKTGTITKDDKEVSSFGYELQGKGTDSSDRMTSTQVDLSEYDVSFEVYDSNNGYVSGVGKTGTTMIALDLDDNWHKIWSFSKNVDTVLSDSLDDGTYTIKVIPSGSLTYQGSTGDFIDADLPSSVSFNVVKKTDNTISVSFSDGYKVG